MAGVLTDVREKIMSMQTEDLYDARKRIIQLEYDLNMLKINLKFWFQIFIINFVSAIILGITIYINTK